MFRLIAKALNYAFEAIQFSRGKSKYHRVKELLAGGMEFLVVHDYLNNTSWAVYEDINGKTVGRLVEANSTKCLSTADSHVEPFTYEMLNWVGARVTMYVAQDDWHKAERLQDWSGFDLSQTTNPLRPEVNKQHKWLQKLVHHVPRGYGLYVANNGRGEKMFAGWDTLLDEFHITLYRQDGTKLIIPYGLMEVYGMWLDGSYWQRGIWEPLGDTRVVRAQLAPSDPRRWYTIESKAFNESGSAIVLSAHRLGLEPATMFGFTIELDDLDWTGYEINLADLFEHAIKEELDRRYHEDYRILVDLRHVNVRRRKAVTPLLTYVASDRATDEPAMWIPSTMSNYHFGAVVIASDKIPNAPRM